MISDKSTTIISTNETIKNNLAEIKKFDVTNVHFFNVNNIFKNLATIFPKEFLRYYIISQIPLHSPNNHRARNILKLKLFHQKIG